MKNLSRILLIICLVMAILPVGAYARASRQRRVPPSSSGTSAVRTAPTNDDSEQESGRIVAPTVPDPVPGPISNRININYNNRFMYFSPEPLVIDGTTFIDLRAISKIMGLGFSEAEEGYTISKGEKNITVSTQDVNGRSFVPLREVAEFFGAELQWDDETKTAFIKEAGQ